MSFPLFNRVLACSQMGLSYICGKDEYCFVFVALLDFPLETEIPELETPIQPRGLAGLRPEFPQTAQMFNVKRFVSSNSARLYLKQVRCFGKQWVGHGWGPE